MGDVPSEERRVIDELVKFWQSRYEPRDLVIHIDRLSSTWGSGIGVSFFRQVYEDLHTGKRGEYAVSSATEFKQFLETEYIHQAKAYAEHEAQIQAQTKAEAERLAQEKARNREEREKRAKEDFDALGIVMGETTNRAELVELGRQRTALAQLTGVRYDYESHCFRCTRPISSAIHARCPSCVYYICGYCGACFCNYIL